MRNANRIARAVTSSVVLSLLMSTCVMAQGMAKEKSLYERVGGYDALAKVVDEFIVRLVGDQRFNKFFVGHSADSQKRIRQHILDQFCAATGGPCIYTGRDMKTTHQGLAITEADWEAAAKHLVGSLDKFKVPQKEKDEIISVACSICRTPVEK